MPSEEMTFRKGLDERMQRFETDTRESLARIETTQANIDKKVSYTNGKVRKIIISLAILAGIVIGQNFTNVHDIIEVLAHAI